MSDILQKALMTDSGDGFLCCDDLDFLQEYEPGHSSCDDNFETSDTEDDEDDGIDESSYLDRTELLIGNKWLSERESKPNYPEDEEIRKLEELMVRLQKMLDMNTKLRDKLLLKQENLARLLHDTVQERLILLSSDSNVKIENCSPETNALLVRSFISQFGMPYFKDSDLYPCPPNEDYKTKVRRKELISHEVFSSLWKEDEIRFLEKGIKQCLIDEHNRSVTTIKSSSKAYAKYINEKGLSFILRDNPDRDFDWMKIAAKYVLSHTPSECMKMWSLYAKPTLRRERWSEVESKKLRAIASKYGCHNWEAIASEMNNKRSPLQCFVHFRTRITAGKNLGKWTSEEDQRLKIIVEDCMFRDFIHWPKVKYFMIDRSLSQIYNRWNNTLAFHLKKGKFTATEDRQILMGMMVQGLNTKQIASRLGNRSTAQVHARYKNHLKSQLDHKQGDWTVEEDKKLLELVSELGETNWAVIAKKFETRNRMQIRHRHKLLKRKMEDPEFDLSRLRRWGRQGLTKKAKRTRKTVGNIESKIKPRAKRKYRKKSDVIRYVQRKRKVKIDPVLDIQNIGQEPVEKKDPQNQKIMIRTYTRNKSSKM